MCVCVCVCGDILFVCVLEDAANKAGARSFGGSVKMLRLKASVLTETEREECALNINKTRL